MIYGSRRSESSGTLGIWLFICTEVLLFGGLFLLYSMYRFKNPADFHAGSMELSRFLGTLNTCILITSSMSAAIAIHFLQENKITRAFVFFITTLLLGLSFLGVKAFEWGIKFMHGLYPGSHVLLSKPKGEILFFGLYFMMTGLHAVHVIVGILVISFFTIRMRMGKITSEKPGLLVNSGLYWHLVDIIWIFLYPLFYLIS